VTTVGAVIAAEPTKASSMPRLSALTVIRIAITTYGYALTPESVVGIVGDWWLGGMKTQWRRSVPVVHGKGKGKEYETDMCSFHQAGRDFSAGLRVPLLRWQNKNNTGWDMPERINNESRAKQRCQESL